MRAALATSQPARKLASFFIIFMLLVSPLAPVIFSSGSGSEDPDSSQSRATDDAAHVWQQFQRDSQHSGTYLEGLRGVDDPIIQWDNKEKFENYVHSYSITAGDFALLENIDVVGGGKYDRDVEHVLYSGQYEGGNNETIFIVDGQTGESMWELTIDEDVDVETSVVIGDLDGNNMLDIAFADTAGVVYAYEPQITYEKNRPKGDRYSWNEYNDEAELLWKYETGTDHTVLETSLLLADLNDDGYQDVVLGHIDSADNGFLLALDGNAGVSGGDELWEQRLEHGTSTRISTPVLMDYKGTKSVWVTVYGAREGDGNTRLWVYKFSADGAEVFGPEDFAATRGSTNLGLPAPVIYDIDDDESPDVIVCVPQDPDNEGDTGSIYIFHRDLKLHRDWDTGIPAEGRIDATPVVGKLHKSHEHVLVVQSWEYAGSVTTNIETFVEAFNQDANRVWREGFDTDPADTFDDRATASPVLFDMDGNGLLDVISATTPRIYALDGTNGNHLDGFPYTLPEDDENAEHAFLTSMAVGDMDRDGIFDIVIDGLMLTHTIPDLLITNVDILSDEEQPKHNEEVEIEATIRNNGTDEARNVKVNFYMNGELIGDDTVGMDRERSDTAKIDWTAKEGHHKLYVVVDPENKKEESIETNNDYEMEFDILSPYGVNIYYDDIRMEADPTADQGARYQIEIENNGTEEENMTLEHSDLLAGWDVAFYGVSTGRKVLLESKERKNITVEVSPPKKARAGERFQLMVWVNTTHGGKSKNVTLTTDVAQYHQVEVNYVSESEQEVTPNERVDFILEVVNTGNGNDKFKLTAEDVPYDWKTKINSKSSDIISIPYGGSSEVTLTVIAPAMNDIDNYDAYIDLRAESDYNNSVFAAAETYTEISSIMVEDNGQHVEPEATHQYTVVVFNLGDKDENISLDANSETFEDWYFELKDDYLLVGAKESGETILSVTVPKDAEPETLEMIRLNANFHEEGQGELSGETHALTFAKQIYRVDILSCKYDGNDTDLQDENNASYFLPNENISYTLKVQNNGNGVDNISWELKNLPASWDYSISPEVASLQPVGTAGDTVDIVITIHAYHKARAFSTYDIELVVVSQGDPLEKDIYSLELNVKRRKGFEVEIDDDFKMVKPENYVGYNVTFANTGNWYDEVEIQVKNGPHGGWTVAWNNRTRDFNLSLSPHQEITFELRFHCPGVLHENASAGTVDTTLLWTRLNSTRQREEIDIETEVEQVYLGELDVPLEADITPSETLSFFGTMRNTGNGEEEVKVRSRFFQGNFETQYLDGWDYTLRDTDNKNIPEDQAHFLEMNETMEFYLNLSAPDIEHENAEAGFLASVVLIFYQEVNDEENPIRIISMDFVNTTMQQVFDIRVYADTESRNVVPEEELSFMINVENHGNGLDVVEYDTVLMTTGASEAEDWSFDVDLDKLELKRGQSDFLIATLSPPGFNRAPEHGDTAEVTFYFLSDQGTRNDSVDLTITGKISQMMILGSPHQDVVPYTGMNFTLVFARLANSNKELFTLRDLEDIGNTIPREWTVDYYPLDGTSSVSTFNIGNQLDKKYYRLGVMPRTTSHARYGDGYTFKLESSNDGKVDQDQVTVTVDHYYALRASVENDTKEGEPDDVVEFKCRVENLGNAEDLFLVTIDNRDEQGVRWPVVFQNIDMEGQDTGYVGLGYGDMLNFTVQVTIPEDALSGTTTLNLSAQSEGGPMVLSTVALNVTVDQILGMAIISFENQKESEDDEDVYFDFLVRNTGNIKDSYSFEALPNEESYFTSKKFDRSILSSLEPGEYGEMKFTIHVEPDVPEGEYLITLTVKSRKDSAYRNQTQVTIKVTPKPKPDLVVESISVQPPEPDEDDEIAILIIIKNQGFGDATAVEVELSMDGKFVKTFSTGDVGPILSGKTRTLQYKTELSEGLHVLSVWVDSEEKLSETNEDNNRETQEIQVAKVDNSGPDWLLIIGAILVLGAIVLGVVKMKGETDDEEDRPRSQAKKQASSGATGAKKKPAPGGALARERKGPEEDEGDVPEEEDLSYEEELPEKPKGAVAKKRPAGIAITGEDRGSARSSRSEEKDTAFPRIIKCNICHAKIKVKQAGKFRCPQCKSVRLMTAEGKIKVPAEFPIQVDCPECGLELKVKEKGKFRCSRCKAVSEVDDEGKLVEELVDFTGGLAISCPIPDCGTRLKVRKPGPFKCPRCKTVSQIDNKGQISPYQPEEEEDKEEKKEEVQAKPKARRRAAVSKEVKFPVLKICPSCGESTKVEKPGWNKCEHCNFVMEVNDKGRFSSELSQDKDEFASDYHEHDDMMALRKEMGGIKETVHQREARRRAEEAKRRAVEEKRRREAAERRRLAQERARQEQEEAAQQQQEEQWEEAEFPMILNCRYCEKKVKVSKPGKFRCPACKEIDEIDAYGQFPEEEGDDQGEWEEAEFPMILNCRYCEKKVKVNKAGKFRCPACKEIDEIDTYGQYPAGEEEDEGGDDQEQEDEGSWDEEDDREPVEFPQVIKCRHCKKKMRVHKMGAFKCPTCQETDEVDEYCEFVD